MAYLGYLVGIIGILMGVVIGLMTGANPLYAGLMLLVPAAIVFFFKNVEFSILALLILRSALDPFSNQGLPSAFAIAFSALALLYITVQLLCKQPVQIDAFGWLFAGWILIQGIWVILLYFGGLGLGVEQLPTAVREWVRIFSWLMAYLLVFQIKGRLRPEQVASALLLALVIPVSTAFLQMTVPGHLLPSFLAVNVNQDGFRINGTLGVANTFVTFLTLFIGLTYWKISISKNRLPWFFLLGALVLCLVTTKTLVGIMMLVVLITALVVPRLSFGNLIGSVLLLTAMVGLFGSTEQGMERLGSISQTPLLNPNIDVSRAILLSSYDQNSFNWRIAQWSALMGHWSHAPILGYGLQTTNFFGPMFAWAHNDYVRVLVEEGVVGLVLFLSFLGIQLIRLLRLIRSPFTERSQKSFCSVLVAFLLAAMVGMLTENVWSHTALFFYWFSLSAIVDWKWGDPEELPLQKV
jgi:O-antigen ligase